MNKIYTAPELNIITFEVTDVITHSLALDNGTGDIDYTKPGGGFADATANAVTYDGEGFWCNGFYIS